MTEYTNAGFLQKTKDGFEGNLNIEDIDISPIEGMFFVYEKDKKQYLWLKRKPMMEYNIDAKKYVFRAREPRWEVYMKKHGYGDVAFTGEFVFLHFKFKIDGIWDKSENGQKKKRINLFVERLPMQDQTIINNINERIKRHV